MKLIITEEEKKDILSRYGIISEQSVILPVRIVGSFIASDCDELHVFQSTGGKVIGDMNVIVGKKLDEVYKAGINPKVTKVSVRVNDAKMEVSWSATIEESKDGKSWIGFTSRGAGCGSDVYERAESNSSGNDIGTLESKIKSTFGENKIDIQVVNDFVYEDEENGFRQIFYRYTKPSKFPPR